MKDFCSFVNTFQGCGEIDLPKPQGVAKTWHFIKALSGNTHPGAVLPFGKISCCPYSGGYSSGYGKNKLNCGGSIKKLSETVKIKGFSHLNHSGIGALGLYYNYAVTTPFFGDISQTENLKDISEEYGVPGYYHTMIEPEKIKCEISVSQKCAVHRYLFPKNNGRISIDFSNDGLYDEKLRSYSEFSELEILSENEVQASVIMQGIKLYFYVLCKGSHETFLWEDFSQTDKTHSKYKNSKNRFGCVFDLKENDAEIRLGVSTKGFEKSKRDVLEEKRSFEEIKKSAYDLWNNALSKIEIEPETEDDYEVFYSNLYHSLIKPCDWSGEDFVSDCNDDFMVDFCTLWDIYKTQLPLIFSLYPEISSKIVNTYINLGETLGSLPNTFVLSNNYNIEAIQACMLAEHIMADAYLRGVKNVDFEKMLSVILKDMSSEQYEEFFKTGYLEKTTKMLDMAESCASIALIAEELGFNDMYKKLNAFKDNWRKAFDEKTGLLKDSYDYYEGNLWSYSFRPLNNMNERIELCKNSLCFIDLLDRFFGFDSPNDKTARFQGFNNETDMETPYAYHYVGRHDRISEIVDGMYKYMFTKGRGGLPGNNDSGGLSSCYIWNTLGIFPVCGQDLMIIGLPCFKKVKIHLANGNKLEIKKHGKGIYVQSAKLNGKTLDQLSFGAREMMNGGRLDITVSDQKCEII